ncbi:MAG: sortase [Propionibacteriales bacterium]|nr:sortase [Propionibacteriales bacterium]
MALIRLLVVGAVALLVLAVAGCSATLTTSDAAERPPSAGSTTAPSKVRATTPGPTASPTPTATESARTPARKPSVSPSTAAPHRSRAGKPRRAWVSIPSIGIDSLLVVPYVGRPDDLPGTRIQNRGIAASPHGPGGGVGPGGIGNLIITAHRTSAGAPFGELPALEHGQHILVRAGGKVYDYVMTRTRWTSFRSKLSLARQSAPVPGHPGRRPTRAMITLSTCATPEDHARGNYWTDALGNPEHRIDNIGVLKAVRPSR